jgi:signal transduction histidine kinase
MTLESTILAGFRAGIVSVASDGTVTYVNPIAHRILGIHALEPGDSIHEKSRDNDFFRVISDSISLNYLPARLEVELTAGDGEHRTIGFTLAELKEGGVKAGVCAFFKDLTHVEMDQENENLKQRLLLLGQMAAGLAHEIRNPIASIGVHLGIVKKHFPGEDERLRTSFTLMEREISKVEYIIKECLGFVRPADLGLQPVSLPAFLGGLVQRFREMSPRMEVTLSVPQGKDVVVKADPGLLEQAILNILTNAADACGGKGKVDILLGCTRHFTDRVRLSRRAEPLLPPSSGVETDYARITVRDDGPGIPEEIREKIFVPFFTTKKTGTGIGLAMAQKIVHSHGGVIDLRSASGEGTEFILKIPLKAECHG